MNAVGTPSPRRMQADFYEGIDELADLEPLPVAPDATYDVTDQPSLFKDTPPRSARAHHVARRMPSPNENSPSSDEASSHTPELSRLPRPYKGASMTPHIRSSPSGRARKPLGVRASSQPLMESPNASFESESLPLKKQQQPRSPSLPPQLPPSDSIDHSGYDEEDPEARFGDDETTATHPQTGRGWSNAQAPAQEPPLSPSSSLTNESSESLLESPPRNDEESEHDSVSILSASRIQPPATADDGDDTNSDFSHEAPESISSPIAPVRTHQHRLASNQTHRPVRPSPLSHVIIPGSPTSTSTGSPAGSTEGSPAHAIEARTPRANESGDYRTAYLLGTLRKTVPVSLQTAAKSRLKPGTPYVRVQPQSDDETTSASVSDSSISDATGPVRRANSSMPVVGVDDDENIGRPIDAQAYIRGFKAQHAIVTEQNEDLRDENAKLRAALEEQTTRTEEYLRRVEESNETLEQDHSWQVSQERRRADELSRRLKEAHSELERERQATKRAQDAQDIAQQELQKAYAQIDSAMDEARLKHEVHVQQIEELRRSSKAKDDRIESLSADVERLREAANHDDDESSGADHRMELAEEQIRRLEKLIEAKEGELIKAGERHTNDSEEIAALKYDVEQAQRRYEEVDEMRDQHYRDTIHEREVLEAKLAMALDKIDRAEAAEAAATEAHRIVQEDATLAIETNAAPLVAQIERAERDKRRLDSKLAELEEQLIAERRSRGNGDHDRLITEAASLRNRLRDCEAGLAKVSDQLEDEKQRHAAAKNEVSRLRSTLEGPAAYAGHHRVAELEATVKALERRLKEAHLAATSPAGRWSAAGTPLNLQSVHLARTPLSIGANLSGLRSSIGANQSSALYEAEIARMQETIQNLRTKLAAANTSIDQKVAALEGAVSSQDVLHSELAQQRRHNAELRVRLDGASGPRPETSPSGHSMNEDIRAAQEDAAHVRDELHRLRLKLARMQKERDDTLHECDTNSRLVAQLRDEISRLRNASQNTPRLQHDLARAGDRLKKVNARCLELQEALAKEQAEAIRLREERSQMHQDIAGLRRELQGIRLEANAFQRDLGAITRIAHGARDGDGFKRGEGKGLLLYIHYLKLRCVREASLRANLAQQKGYLEDRITEKQHSLLAARRVLAQHGLNFPAEPVGGPPTFKGAVLAVMAITRMRNLSEEWRRHEAIKHSVRAAWERKRGRAWGT